MSGSLSPNRATAFAQTDRLSTTHSRRQSFPKAAVNFTQKADISPTGQIATEAV